MSAEPTMSERIRALLKANGPLNRDELRALLPGYVNAAGQKVLPRAKQLTRNLADMAAPPKRGDLGPLIRSNPDGRFEWLRDPPPRYTPEQAAQARREVDRRRLEKRKAVRAARGLKPSGRRTSFKVKREKDYSTRQQNAATAQAINRQHLGLRDMPPDVRPCTDAWLAANADKYERLPSRGPLAVSPASRFARLKMEA